MLFDPEKINAFWYESKNWGDALSPLLIQYFSRKKPFLIDEYTLNLKNEPIYAVIGSILGFPIMGCDRILKNTIIIMYEKSRFPFVL